jgi:multiple antibiotic resistance protein
LGQHLQAIVTLLALINPVMCATIFMQIEASRPRPAQVADATRAALTVLVILTLAALVGARILHIFGVSLDAFSVAGGGVLAWIGFSMLGGTSSGDHQSQPDGEPSQTSLTPLILFAASPGTITGVITLAVAHARLAIPVTALVAVAVGAAAMWATIVLTIRLDRAGSRGNGTSFVRDTVTRFMGLIVIAMGVQFALTGIQAFFNEVGAK